MEPTPAAELDDPLRQAAVNLQRQQAMEEETRRTLNSVDAEKDRICSPRVHSAATLGDVEKGSVHHETARHSGEWPRPGSDSGMRERREDKDKEEPKAVIRVEIHDTGVGLRKEDLEE